MTPHDWKLDGSVTTRKVYLWSSLLLYIMTPEEYFEGVRKSSFTEVPEDCDEALLENIHDS